MAFNKTKSLEAAQRFLNQGKTAQAIQEYQEVLRHDSRDQVTLMTVGDLYVRQGESFKALEYFERLAQLYAKDGFLTKAIAIYKKIAKLAPEETRPLERLAELYVLQGVMSEARPLYLQLAETHARVGRQTQAVGLLRKLVEAEPDNLRVHLRLAELYLSLHQKKEAAATLLDSAERQFDRGEVAEGERLADRALEIDPALASATMLKARALASKGHHAESAALLEKLPSLDAGGDATELLIEEHLRAGKTHRAAEVARMVFHRDAKKFALAAHMVTALVESGDPETALELLDEIREAMTESGEQEQLAKLLKEAAGRLPGRLEPHEWLVELYSRLNDSFHFPEALAQLGAAAAAAGHLERAQQAYEQLRERLPEDLRVAQRLNEVRAQLGLAPAIETPATAEVEEEEPAPKPFVEPPLDEETQRFVAQSLTDADLFSSYGLSQKAVTLLESVLQRAPRHTPALEKLLDLCLGAGDSRRTAVLAARLERIYEERGDPNNVDRFSQLRRSFQKAAGLSDAELAAGAAPAPAAEFGVPAAETTGEAPPTKEKEEELPAPESAAPAGEPRVHDVDFSKEWAEISEQVHSALESAPPAAPAMDVPPAAKTPPPQEVLAAEAPVTPGDLLLELAKDLGGESEKTAPQPAGAAPLPIPVPERPAPGPAKKAARTPPVPPKLPATPAPPASATIAAAPGTSSGATAAEPRSPLSEIFDEFRAELGEMGDENEDLETHYNLGTAYREMGLLEEAIGEFQRVAQASQNGRPFPYAMQCCTLLGLSFMEKGQPQIAAIWYERALRTPDLGQDSILALRYDLGVAQEQAGDADAALKSFSQVYAINIDYRDVAERISALGKRR